MGGVSDTGFQQAPPAAVDPLPPVGSDGDVLTVVSGAPAWAPPSGGGGNLSKLARVYTDLAPSGASGYSIFASNPSQTDGPVKLAANTATPGGALLYEFSGTWVNGAVGAVSPNITLRLASSTLASGTLIPALAPGTYGMAVRGTFTVQTAGASGAVMGHAFFEFTNQATGVVTKVPGSNAAFVSPNFTADAAVEIIVNPGDASASMAIDNAAVYYSS